MNFGFNTPFDEQLEFFRNKIKLPSERWDDITRAAHDRAFIVAGAMKADLLADLNGAVGKAISGGGGQEAFNRRFSEIVGKHGWHGWTGEGSKAGEAWRMRVIFETNLLTSRAAGRYRQLSDPKLLSVRPYWRYVHNDSVMHPRPMHALWGQQRLTLRYDHPFWQTHFPPNGWGCQCRVASTSGPADDDARSPPDGWNDVDDKGRLPGIDRGFEYAPGASVTEELRALVAGKVATLPTPLGQALASDAAGVVGTVSYTNDLRQSVLSVARGIAEKPVEHLVILDRNGGELLRKVGRVDMVELADDELKLLRNHTLIHNHPGEIPEGLSLADLRLALWHEMRQMHAVDSLYMYTLERAAGTRWGPAYLAEVEAVWARVKQDVVDRLEAAFAQGKITEQQQFALQEHMILLEVDAEKPIGYTRTLRKDLEP